MNATTTPPAPLPAPPLMTAEEFLNLHGHESGVELIRGRVVRTPMPGGKHGEVCFNTAVIIGGFVKRQGLGRVMSNDTFIRTGTGPDTFRGADVCYLSYARLPKEQETPDGPIPAPDLVVEVRSPTDRLHQLAGKAAEYLDAGVAVVVVLDPQTASAAVFRPDELARRFDTEAELALPDVLPGFAVPVTAFFE